MNEENDSRNLYRLTHEILNKRTGTTPQQLVVEGRLLRKPKEMADALVNFYESKIKKILGKIKNSTRNPHRFLDAAMKKWDGSKNVPTFDFSEISISETDLLISTLSNSSAMGHDNFDAKGIKEARSQLVKPIRHIINSSLRNGKFVMKWKCARITPRHKNSDLDRVSVSSFRPVAVLPVVSKLLERTVQKQLLSHFEDNKLFNQSCHAYRKERSTTTTITEVLDEIYQGAEERKITELMALDLTAAFDTVDHGLLVEKLSRYGVGRRACLWVEDYLRDRSQYVVLGRAKSETKKLVCGVPQGSVVGPLFYAIYTNDMTEAVKRNNCRNEAHGTKTTLFGTQCRECGVLTQYADDSTYTVSSRIRRENQNNINRTLEALKLYLNDNRLELNLPKTSITEIMIQQKWGKMAGNPPEMIVKDENGIDKCIDDKIYTRVLGANIQNNMLWEKHLESGKRALLPQIRRQLGQLKFYGGQIPRTCRRNIANGLLLSKFNYLITQWGSADETHLKKAQIVLNSIARWVTGLRKRTRIGELMEAVNWYTIKENVMIATAIETWKLSTQGKTTENNDEN